MCLDRGGKIVVTPDGKVWLDLLLVEPPVDYGTPVEVAVIYPKGDGWLDLWR